MEQDYINDDGLVERLLAALADALRRTRREPFGAPVTVAEIYQDLVPYRSVRTELGFQMNADYEHTVLRLLAGEQELARLEPEEARNELRAELDMPNPNVGLFRKFAACDVWILRSDLSLGGDTAYAAAEPPKPKPEPPKPKPEPPKPPPLPTVPESDSPYAPPVAEPKKWAGGVQPLSWAANPAEPEARAEPEPDFPLLELDTELVGGEPEAEAIVEGDTLDWAEPEPPGEWDAAEGELLLEEEARDVTPLPEVQNRPSAPDTSEQPAAAGSQEPTHQTDTSAMFDSSQKQGSVATAHAAGSCSFCQGSLPVGRVVRFCPSCGADQSMKPCGSCREPLEPSWKFCIGCGSQQS